MTIENNLQKKTVHGVIWSGIERFSLQGVQFFINIIMARILLPSDYGMIGMLVIFLQISQIFIDTGLQMYCGLKSNMNSWNLVRLAIWNREDNGKLVVIKVKCPI